MNIFSLPPLVLKQVFKAQDADRFAYCTSTGEKIRILDVKTEEQSFVCMNSRGIKMCFDIHDGSLSSLGVKDIKYSFFGSLKVFVSYILTILGIKRILTPMLIGDEAYDLDDVKYIKIREESGLVMFISDKAEVMITYKDGSPASVFSNRLYSKIYLYGR